MDVNAKIARVEALRRKQAKHVAALADIEAELCPLLCELLSDHGPANGVGDDVISAASAPKDGGGK